MKDILRHIVVLAFVIICGFILTTSKITTIAKEDIPTESSETIVDPIEIPTVEASIPTELSIESIGVKASIELVGVVNGAMGVPILPENVGWYDLGTRPGDIGSAVFAGHVNWKDSPNAVFTNLKKIKIGDMITVTNSDGSIIYFSVTKIKDYPLYADTNEVFSSDDGLAHVNLITCDGLWDALLKSHVSRLVIFTDKIPLLQQ